MRSLKYTLLFLSIMLAYRSASTQVAPDQIQFIRKGVHRMIFDQDQSIPLASLNPRNIVGISAMHPAKHYTNEHPDIFLHNGQLVIESLREIQTSIWFGSFNPFATYSIELDSCIGAGEVGFEFSDIHSKEQVLVKVAFNHSQLTGVKLTIIRNSDVVVNESISTSSLEDLRMEGKIILQMLGSGFTLYLQDQGLPKVIGQSDFNLHLDLRSKHYMQFFHSHLYVHLNNAQIRCKNIDMALSTGIGLADIRAITYENGDPMFDRGRLWYTMSIRGRALPHHIQGVFSMNPTVFDLKLEGIILFDREDGLLRNEIASHLFFDRKHHIWRGLTTGFSAYANPEKEKKQLLTVESQLDPRFGFSVMKASPFGMVGDIEDPHILFDETDHKWRILTCENIDGYKAIVLESEQWNRGYRKIAGPVAHNSTGTSIQRIGDQLFCFSGSSEREVFIYSYPDLREMGTLKMDLPPWSKTSRTRVWPNIVQLPNGYAHRYVALMMDRFNHPGVTGPHWTYGALYLYYGYDTK